VIPGHDLEDIQSQSTLAWRRESEAIKYVDEFGQELNLFRIG
jgi:hypothetical protein